MVCVCVCVCRAGRNEGIKAYAEVLQWLLLVVAPHVEAALSATQATPGSAAPAATAAAGDPAEAAEAADTYRVLILQGTLRAHIVPATLGVVQKLPGVAPEAAKDLLLQLLRHLALAAHKAGAADTPAGRALRAVQEVTAESAAAEMRGAVAATAPAAPRDAPYSNTEGLIVSFRELDGVCEGVPSTAGVVCAAVTAALVHSMRTGEVRHAHIRNLGIENACSTCDTAPMPCKCVYAKLWYTRVCVCAFVCVRVYVCVCRASKAAQLRLSFPQLPPSFSPHSFAATLMPLRPSQTQQLQQGRVLPCLTHWICRACCARACMARRAAAPIWRTHSSCCLGCWAAQTLKQSGWKQYAHYQVRYVL